MAGYAGLGITVSIAGTDAAELVSAAGPNMSKDTHDISNMEDTWREFAAGLVDIGEVTLGLNFDPFAHDAVAELITATVPSAIIITWPDTGSSTWTFSAFITAFAASGEIDGKLAASVTLKGTGALTMTGSS